MTYEIRNPEIEELLKGLGKFLGDQMPPGWGFTLLIFSFGEGGSSFYISNAQRPDMLLHMQEFVDRQTH